MKFEMESIFPFYPSECFLEKSSVIAVREYVGWPLLFGRGVPVLHTNKNSPPFVVLWTWRPKKLLRELQALGHLVQKRRMWWDTLTRPDEFEV